MAQMQKILECGGGISTFKISDDYYKNYLLVEEEVGVGVGNVADFWLETTEEEVATEANEAGGPPALLCDADLMGARSFALLPAPLFSTEVIMEALYPDFWIFLSSLATQICCSSEVGANRSMSLAVVGS